MRKIVFVNNNGKLLDYYRNLFREEYEIVTFIDIPRTLRWLESEYTDLLITDYRMPGMPRFIETVREHYPHIPCLLIASRNMLRDGKKRALRDLLKTIRFIFSGRWERHR